MSGFLIGNFFSTPAIAEFFFDVMWIDVGGWNNIYKWKHEWFSLPQKIGWEWEDFKIEFKKKIDELQPICDFEEFEDELYNIVKILHGAMEDRQVFTIN